MESYELSAFDTATFYQTCADLDEDSSVIGSSSVTIWLHANHAWGCCPGNRVYGRHRPNRLRDGHTRAQHIADRGELYREGLPGDAQLCRDRRPPGGEASVRPR
jgi:hypothetical protein